MEYLKQKIRRGDTLHGCWVNMGSSLSAEIIGKSGFDWVLIDLEHGVGNEKDAFHQLQALSSTGCTPMVRIGEVSRYRAQQMLDMGAEGLMFPQIKSLEEAKLAAASMRYGPKGVRGVATMIRVTDFGASVEAYQKGVADRLLGIIQIETLESLEILHEIAAIDGVDILFIGPADLSMSLGVFKQFDHPTYQAAIKKTAKIALDHGKAAGVLMSDPAQYKMYYDMGFRFIACGADSSFVRKGASTMASEMNDYRIKYRQP